MPVAPFDPSLVQIDKIVLSGSRFGPGIEKQGAKHGLPHLGRFLQHIERAQADENERFGRRYQKDILAGSGLTLPSPFTGESVVAVESIAVNGKTFYRFVERDNSGEAVEYFVVASRIRLGFPLAGLFVPKRNWLLGWEGRGNHATGKIHLEAFAGALVARDRLDRISVEPVIVMGHANFAHHLWNELSALETIIRSSSLKTGSSILVAREPLGNLDEIFPELGGHTIQRVDPELPLCGIQTGGLFVNLGAFYIPESLRQRLVAFSRRNASAPATAIMTELEDTGGPVFWISVRSRNPTLVNQHDVLARIAGLIVHEYKRCAVVFDGFSLPEDWTRMPLQMQVAYRQSASDTRKESEAIIATVRSRTHLGPHQVLTTIAGMGIVDCIAIAQSATAYLCHVGSIQHKIGWTANVPGIIHGNRRLSAEELILRHSSRLENGVPPLITPNEFFEDAVSGAEEQEPNYRSVNPGEFTRFVLQHFRQCLSLAPCDQAARTK